MRRIAKSNEIGVQQIVEQIKYFYEINTKYGQILNYYFNSYTHRSIGVIFQQEYRQFLYIRIELLVIFCHLTFCRKLKCKPLTFRVLKNSNSIFHHLAKRRFGYLTYVYVSYMCACMYIFYVSGVVHLQQPTAAAITKEKPIVFFYFDGISTMGS